MINIELVEIYGWRTALKALRRPYNRERLPGFTGDVPTVDEYRIMKNLVVSGDDHAKVMRMIGASFTITAPRYWWMEFDTYTIGRFDLDEEHLSESTMHRKSSEPFDASDFEYEGVYYAKEMNIAREDYVKDKNIEKFKAQLPEGFLQTRDVMLNYQALRHIYTGRYNHRLSQWKIFCDFIIKNVPYAEGLIQGDK